MKKKLRKYLGIIKIRRRIKKIGIVRIIKIKRNQ